MMQRHALHVAAQRTTDMTSLTRDRISTWMFARRGNKGSGASDSSDDDMRWRDGI